MVGFQYRRANHYALRHSSLSAVFSGGDSGAFCGIPRAAMFQRPQAHDGSVLLRVYLRGVADLCLSRSRVPQLVRTVRRRRPVAYADIYALSLLGHAEALLQQHH